jgi:AcrR family transcriptional regulator
MTSKRDHLVDTALRLFQREGFHATGIDRILEEAGVAKMTLYNHFRSKDELVLAALRRADERFRNAFMQRVAASGQTARQRLAGLFVALGEWHASAEFHGCIFAVACAEFTDESHPVPAAAREHKRLMRQFVRGLCADAGAKDPDTLATALCLLMDGATSQARVCRNCDAAKDAARIGMMLIEKTLDAA